MSNTKVPLAVTTFKAGCNCAQAVVCTYGQEFGISSEMACRIATGFGGGMRAGETCGAVAGAIMVLSLKHGAGNAHSPEAKAKTYQMVEELHRRFRARNGSTMCKELLGCDISTPEGMKAARDSDRFRTLCPKMIQDAAEILEEMLAG